MCITGRVLAGTMAGNAAGTTAGIGMTRIAAAGADPTGRAMANVDTAVAEAAVAASRTQGSVWHRAGVGPP